MPTDLEKLQGKWFVSSLEVEGTALPRESLAGAEIVLQGNRFTSLSMGAAYQGTIELDPVREPKALSMVFTEGPEKGNTNHGIYELGTDSWTLCLTMNGGTAPAGFATKPGSGQALETLTRRPPAVEPPPPAGETVPAGEPVPELEGEWAMMSCIRDGQPLDESMVKTGKRIARGGETQALFGQQPFLQARFSVDRSQLPMTIDYVLTAGPNAGKRQLGIYALEGAVLTLLFSAPGQARPTDFTAKASQGKTLSVWRQVKK